MPLTRDFKETVQVRAALSCTLPWRWFHTLESCPGGLLVGVLQGTVGGLGR